MITSALRQAMALSDTHTGCLVSRDHLPTFGLLLMKWEMRMQRPMVVSSRQRLVFATAASVPSRRDALLVDLRVGQAQHSAQIEEQPMQITAR